MKGCGVVACFVLLVLACVDAHTYLSSVTIGGNKRTDCLRSLGTNSPIASVTSNDMTCGFLPKGAAAASAKCPIAAGSTIGLQWNHNNPDPSDDIIDPSHKGPCLAYLSSDNGATWFKIYEDGFNTATQTWCVIKLIANKGYVEVTIPKDIAPGNYLIRAEIIALHEAYKLNGAQPYVDCAELTITGSGTAKPTAIAIPGAYSPNDPGIFFDIYASPMATYVIPGPAVYTVGSGSGSGSASGSGGSGDSIKSSPESSGMSSGGKAALSLFFIGLVAAIACGAFYYHKNGHIFGYAYTKGHGIQHLEPRKAGSYTAYADQS